MKHLSILLVLFIASCSTPTYLKWGYDSGVYRFEREQYDRAAMYFNELAIEHNDYRSQYYLGLLWEYGLGNTDQDSYQAAEWFYRSAAQGYPLAMYRLALVQTSINGLNEASISWANLAARWGNEKASGFLAANGLDVPYPDLYEAQQARIAHTRALEIEQQNQRTDEITNFIFDLLTIGAIALAVDSNTNLTPVPSVPSTSADSGLYGYVNSQPPVLGSSQARICPDGSYVIGNCQVCPDGTYISGGGRCFLTPKGNYVRQVGNESPILTPDGTYVSGGRGYTLCPDGSYHSGRRCSMAPDGTFLTEY